MRLNLIPVDINASDLEELRTELSNLDLHTLIQSNMKDSNDFLNIPVHKTNSNGAGIVFSNLPKMLEDVISKIPINLDSLPVLFDGESKKGWLLTNHVVVERFKPTVYSYTSNRYGEVPGTAEIRLQFSAEIFRQMSRNSKEILPNAFLSVTKAGNTPLLVQRRVETCNVETRVKRYHIGSPVYRYLYTEQYPSTQRSGPLKRWDYFESPVICFDWRHPVHDKEGNRLADEPISDDYAAIWMADISKAKYLARNTFLWLEENFKAAGFALIDICFFIDQPCKMLYGEISPDCMRVRKIINSNSQTVSQSDCFAKDTWRLGKEPKDLLQRYQDLYSKLFEAQHLG